jgi:alpha-galactosidase
MARLSDRVVSVLGVGLIKLDFVTPGSPWNGANLLATIAQPYKLIRLPSRDLVTRYDWISPGNSPVTRLIFHISAVSQNLWEPIKISTIMANLRSLPSRKYNVLLITIVNTSLSRSNAEFLSRHIPDMDNLFVGNSENITWVSDTQRYTIMNHRLGAAANLIIGSDLTTLDDLGIKLLTSPQSVKAANFFA